MIDPLYSVFILTSLRSSITTELPNFTDRIKGKN